MGLVTTIFVVSFLIGGSFVGLSMIKDSKIGKGVVQDIVGQVVDSDNDGLSDAMEKQLGTSYDSSDTDKDGMPDGYEVKNNLDPLVDDANLDNDKDGLSNKWEKHLGTDPNKFDKPKKNENTICKWVCGE